MAETLDIRKLAEARMAEFQNRNKAAYARWQPYISLVETHYKSEGRELLEYQKANIFCN